MKKTISGTESNKLSKGGKRSKDSKKVLRRREAGLMGLSEKMPYCWARRRAEILAHLSCRGRTSRSTKQRALNRQASTYRTRNLPMKATFASLALLIPA